MQLGLRIATVDLGGWDTHEFQGNGGGGYFADHLGELAAGMAAFFTDLSNDNGTDHTRRLTLAVMSEFGRSFEENASAGTDHGHGNVMFVLRRRRVDGGLVHGTWPGLATEQLYDRRDLAISTDYRRVCAAAYPDPPAGQPETGGDFPRLYGLHPLGIVQGTDLPPEYGAAGPTADARGPSGLFASRHTVGAGHFLRAIGLEN